MQIPAQVTFHGIDHSDSLESVILDKTRKLERLCPRITSARVTVGLAEKRKHQGKIFKVRIDITLPGQEIVVDRDPSLNHAHEDPYVAVRDAFRAAKRQVEDYVRTHFRSKKRLHQKPAQAKVLKILLENDGGFLKSQDGREIYFHKNSVINQGFDQIKVGDEVRFVEEMGELGPQASTVEKIGKWATHQIYV